MYDREVDVPRLVGHFRLRPGQLAPHNDYIALLSLGATRRLTIRAKAAPGRVFHVDLVAGSLLLMSYETQLHYTHGVPKTSEPVGPRGQTT